MYKLSLLFSLCAVALSQDIVPSEFIAPRHIEASKAEVNTAGCASHVTMSVEGHAWTGLLGIYAPRLAGDKCQDGSVRVTRWPGGWVVFLEEPIGIVGTDKENANIGMTEFFYVRAAICCFPAKSHEQYGAFGAGGGWETDLGVRTK